MRYLLNTLRYIQRKVFNPYCKYVDFLSRLGNNIPLHESELKVSRTEMYVVTIAYNDERLIRKQIEAVKTFITDEHYKHIIVDNSPTPQKRKLIREVCQEYSIDYIPVPLYIHRLISTRLFWCGISHGAALNWMFYKFLIYRGPVHFALLDHDIFPTKPYSLTEALGDKPFYGVKRDRGDGWYLWPGFSIFNFEILARIRPNFLPLMTKKSFLDAGGSIYPQLYKQYEIANVTFADDKTFRIKNTAGLKDVYHGDCIQMIDNAWLHLINGSNYAHVKGKEETITQFLAGKPFQNQG